MNLLTKQKQIHRFKEQIYGYWGEEWGEGIVRKFGINMYTLLCLKWRTGKVLLYSTGNSAQCYVAAWMGGEFGGEWIQYMYGCVPLLFTWNYQKIVNQLYPIQNKKLKKKKDTKSMVFCYGSPNKLRQISIWVPNLSCKLIFISKAELFQSGTQGTLGSLAI